MFIEEDILIMQEEMSYCLNTQKCFNCDIYKRKKNELAGTSKLDIKMKILKEILFNVDYAKKYLYSGIILKIIHLHILEINLILVVYIIKNLSRKVIWKTFF